MSVSLIVGTACDDWHTCPAEDVACSTATEQITCNKLLFVFVWSVDLLN